MIGSIGSVIAAQQKPVPPMESDLGSILIVVAFFAVAVLILGKVIDWGLDL